jgi:hypothetical protein
MTAMMFTPALATLLVTRFISRPPEGVRAATGLRLGKGRRWGWYWLFAWLGVALMAAATPLVGALFGLYTLDLTTFSGFRAVLKAAGVVKLLFQEGTTFDSALVGVTGVTGWLLPLVVIGLLVATGRLPVRDAPDLAAAPQSLSRTAAAQ